MCGTTGQCTGNSSGDNAEWSNPCPEGQTYNSIAGVCVIGDANQDLVTGESVSSDQTQTGCATHTSHHALVALLLGAGALLLRRRRRA